MQDVQTTNEQTVQIKSNPDSLFGVCQAVGEDLGFNPFFLRLGFLGLGFFSIPASVAAYALLGAGVAASRWLFPAPQKADAASNADVGPQVIETAREPELLAA
jgi:phage shock protein PspC (stress-responsive transcriptional regulator)